MTENEISREVFDCAVEVHRTLGGPGLLENVYEEALAWGLTERGLHVRRQHQVPITYKGRRLASPLRLDMLVEERVTVEPKATTHDNTIFEAQALTYLRLSDSKPALVINFGEKLVKDGIHRVGNRL
jgi:GxxExxY protein